MWSEWNEIVLFLRKQCISLRCLKKLQNLPRNWFSPCNGQISGEDAGGTYPHPWDEAFFVFTFKPVFLTSQRHHALEVHPPLRKILDPPLFYFPFSQENFSKDNFNTRWVLFCILLSYRESNKFGRKNTVSSFNKLPFSNNSHTSCTTLCTM